MIGVYGLILDNNGIIMDICRIANNISYIINHPQCCFSVGWDYEINRPPMVGS